MKISSRSDLITYVDNYHSDFPSDMAAQLAELIADSADAPDYGSDWSDWLGANADRLRDEVISRGHGIVTVIG